MATNRAFLARFAKIIKDHKSANGGFQSARHVLLRELLVPEPDRQWFSRFFRKQAHVNWLETTCLITVVSEGKNRQLFLANDSLIRMNNLDALSGLDDPALPPIHDLRPPQQPVAATNADDDDDSDSDFEPDLRDESDDEVDSDDNDEEGDIDDENNLQRPVKLDSIFLEKLRFRHVKPDTQRRILNVVLTGMKTTVESHLHPNSREDTDEIILEAAELLKKNQQNWYNTV